MVPEAPFDLDDYIVDNRPLKVYETRKQRVFGVSIRFNGYQPDVNAHRRPPRPHVLLGQVQDTKGERTSLPALNKRRHIENIVEALRDKYADEAEDDHFAAVDTSNHLYYVKNGRGEIDDVYHTVQAATQFTPRLGYDGVARAKPKRLTIPDDASPR